MEMGSSSNSAILLTDTVTAFITAFFLFWTSRFLELTQVIQINSVLFFFFFFKKENSQNALNLYNRDS